MQEKLFKYRTPTLSPLYGLAWSRRSDCPFRLATSTYSRYQNFIELVQLREGLNGENTLSCSARMNTLYPVNDMTFFPSANTNYRDIIAVASDTLTLYDVSENKAYRDRQQVSAIWEHDEDTGDCSTQTFVQNMTYNELKAAQQAAIQSYHGARRRYGSEEADGSGRVRETAQQQQEQALISNIERELETGLDLIPINTNCALTHCMRRYMEIGGPRDQGRLVDDGIHLASAIVSIDWNELMKNRIYCGTSDGLIQITDLENPVPNLSLNVGTTMPVTCVTSAPSNPNILLISSANGSVYRVDLRTMNSNTQNYPIWDAQKYRELFGTTGGVQQQQEQQQSQIQTSPSPASVLAARFSKDDSRFCSILCSSATQAAVLDFRNGGTYSLAAHKGVLNAHSWSPVDPNQLTTVGEDGMAYIWDLSKKKQTTDSPLIKNNKQQIPNMGYNAHLPIANVEWSATQHDWVGIVTRNRLEMLHL